MVFRQLFEPLSSTYTYLIGCEATGQALLIDPVVNSIDRDLAERHDLEPGDVGVEALERLAVLGADLDRGPGLQTAAGFAGLW